MGTGPGAKELTSLCMSFFLFIIVPPRAAFLVLLQKLKNTFIWINNLKLHFCIKCCAEQFKLRLKSLLIQLSTLLLNSVRLCQEFVSFSVLKFVFFSSFHFVFWNYLWIFFSPKTSFVFSNNKMSPLQAHK